jgi:hypothetical protein
MEIRPTQIRELFKSRYPWAGDIDVTNNTDWDCPHWEVSLYDDGVWRTFKIKIDIEEVK